MTTANLGYCRELERQLKEAQDAAEAAHAAKRELEAQCAQQERALETARQQPGGSGGGANPADQEVLVRSLRATLKQQEAQLQEARKLKEHVRCEMHCG